MRFGELDAWPLTYEREDVVFDPPHYLALIERKINALDHAAPLADWVLPDKFTTLRRVLEGRMGKPGKRNGKSWAWRTAPSSAISSTTIRS